MLLSDPSIQYGAVLLLADKIMVQETVFPVDTVGKVYYILSFVWNNIFYRQPEAVIKKS